MNVILIVFPALLSFLLGYVLALLLARKGTSLMKDELSELKSQNEVLAVKAAEAERSADIQFRQAEQQGEARLALQKQQYESALARERETAAQSAAKMEAMHRAALEREHENHRILTERQEQAHARAMEELQKRFDESTARFKSETETATAELLKRRQQEFETSSREGMDRILQPLNETIERMNRTMAENTQKHSAFEGMFAENLRAVIKHSDDARRSADRLASALKGGSKIQGDWGEAILVELFKAQGLTEGVHFTTQAVMRDNMGKVISTDSSARLRPDVVLHLDATRDVIIDSKVSLTAYFDYMEAESEESRQLALKAHIASIERHVAELARKDYSSYLPAGHTGMDYVIMFVPYTAALFAATSVKPELWRNAMEKGVYIADEQTLYAALKIVNLTWRQIAQARNHEQLFGLANEMLQRVGQFMERFVDMGAAIDKARDKYRESFAKLEEKGQSIPQTCRKIIRLGAEPQKRKNVPDELLGIMPEDNITQDNRLDRQ